MASGVAFSPDLSFSPCRSSSVDCRLRPALHAYGVRRGGLGVTQTPVSAHWGLGLPALLPKKEKACDGGRDWERCGHGTQQELPPSREARFPVLYRKADRILLFKHVSSESR